MCHPTQKPRRHPKPLVSLSSPPFLVSDLLPPGPRRVCCCLSPHEPDPHKTYVRRSCISYLLLTHILYSWLRSQRPTSRSVPLASLHPNRLLTLLYRPISRNARPSGHRPVGRDETIGEDARIDDVSTTPNLSFNGLLTVPP